MRRVKNKFTLQNTKYQVPRSKLINEINDEVIFNAKKIFRNKKNDTQQCIKRQLPAKAGNCVYARPLCLIYLHEIS